MLEACYYLTLTVIYYYLTATWFGFSVCSTKLWWAFFMHMRAHTPPYTHTSGHSNLCGRGLLTPKGSMCLMTELSLAELSLLNAVRIYPTAARDMSPVYPNNGDMIFSPLQIYRLAFWPLRPRDPVYMLNVWPLISWQELNAAVPIFQQHRVSGLNGGKNHKAKRFFLHKLMLWNNLFCVHWQEDFCAYSFL